MYLRCIVKHVFFSVLIIRSSEVSSYPYKTSLSETSPTSACSCILTTRGPLTVLSGTCLFRDCRESLMQDSDHAAAHQHSSLHGLALPKTVPSAAKQLGPDTNSVKGAFLQWHRRRRWGIRCRGGGGWLPRRRRRGTATTEQKGKSSASTAPTSRLRCRQKKICDGFRGGPGPDKLESEVRFEGSSMCFIDYMSRKSVSSRATISLYR